MSTLKNASLAAVSLIALAGFPGPASAGTLAVDNVQVPYFLTVDITGTVDGSTVNDHDIIAGQIVLTVHDNGPPAGPQFTLPSWCVDLFHTITLGGHGYQYAEGALTTDNSLNPHALTAMQITDIGDLVAYGDHLMQTSPSDSNSALVQAAIWTAEYNNGSGNSLTVSGAGFTQMDITNTISAAESFGGSAGQLVALDGAQGLTYQTPAPKIGAGLPGFLAVGGLLLGAGLAGRGKKRRAAGTTASSQATA